MSITEHDGGALATFGGCAWDASVRAFKAFDGGQLPPHFHAEKANGQLITLVTPWRSDLEKATYRLIVKQKFAEYGVIRYAMVSEVWGTIEVSRTPVRNPRDFRASVMPRNHPERRSLLYVAAADAWGASLAIFQEIDETATPRVLKGEVEKMDNANGGYADGEMMELLTPVKPIRMHG
jgi:hypothetical protein